MSGRKCSDGARCPFACHFEAECRRVQTSSGDDPYRRIATLTADLEQARENLRLMTLAAKAESERADQLWRERNTAEACADGMQEVARGFEQERDAARRDIGRAAADYLEMTADALSSPRAKQEFHHAAEVLRDAVERDVLIPATTPTADPRDAVVKAARDAAEPYSKDLGTAIMIESMRSHGSSLILNWGEDTGLWEVDWITGGERRCAFDRDLLTALKAAATPARGEES